MKCSNKYFALNMSSSAAVSHENYSPTGLSVVAFFLRQSQYLLSMKSIIGLVDKRQT